MSTVTGFCAAAIAAPAARRITAKAMAGSVGRGRASRLVIFDDPDHPGKILSPVDESDRRAVRFKVLHRDVEAGRVKEGLIHNRRIAHDHPYRKRSRHGQPEPFPDRCGAAFPVFPLLDTRPYAEPEGIELRRFFRGARGGPTPEQLADAPVRVRLRRAGGAGFHVAPDLGRFGRREPPVDLVLKYLPCLAAVHRPTLPGTLSAPLSASPVRNEDATSRCPPS